jgi:hypothetical protein
VKHNLSIPSDASYFVKPNMAYSKEDLVDVDELHARELLELKEPTPSLIVSSPTRDYTGMHIDRHKHLHRGTTWVDHEQRRASINAAPSNPC